MMRRAALAFAILAGLVSPALACEDGDQELFACHVADQHKNIDESETGFSLCGGHEDGDLDNWNRVYYEFWTAKGVEFRYPEDPYEGKTRFFTHNYEEGGLYRFRVRFENGGYTYIIYLDETPAATEPDTINGPNPGVRVFKGKKLLSDHGCTEAPETYFGYIFRATSCDLKNPDGAAACDEMHPPERK